MVQGCILDSFLGRRPSGAGRQHVIYLLQTKFGARQYFLKRVSVILSTWGGGMHGRRGMHGGERGMAGGGHASHGGGCSRGACMAGGRRDGHWSGRYAPYWNVFLFWIVSRKFAWNWEQIVPGEWGSTCPPNPVWFKLHVYQEYLPNISIENNSTSDGARGYRMFGVHNKIHDPAYKARFKVVKTETSAHQIIYSLKIKGTGPFVEGQGNTKLSVKEGKLKFSIFEKPLQKVLEITVIVMADPGFNERGLQPQWGCTNLLFISFFTENCMKMK